MVSGPVALVTLLQHVATALGEVHLVQRGLPRICSRWRLLLGGTGVSQQVALRTVPARIEPGLMDGFGTGKRGPQAGEQG